MPNDQIWIGEKRKEEEENVLGGLDKSAIFGSENRYEVGKSVHAGYNFQFFQIK